MENKKNPTYLKWLFTEHKTGKLKVLLTIVGIIQSIYITPLLIEEYNYGMPLYPAIMGFVASYGFTIGITLQPYSIYKRLVELDWWNKFGN
jgi:hypothetical protein